MTLEVVVGSDKNAARNAQLARYQPGVHLVARADHDVEAFLDDVDHAVRQIEVNVYVRERQHEAVHYRHHEIGELRHADAQPAARQPTGVQQFSLCGGDLDEDAAAADEEHLALGRQLDAARTSVEEPDLVLILQSDNGLADRRCGYSKDAPGLREAADLRGLDERGNADQALHGRLGNRLPTLSSKMRAAWVRRFPSTISSDKAWAWRSVFSIPWTSCQ